MRLRILLVVLTLTSGAAALALDGCSSDSFVAPRFCAAHTKEALCDDFDVEGDASTGLRGDYTATNIFGTFARTSDFASTPFGLAASIQKAPPEAGSVAMLTFDPNVSKARKVRFSARVKLDQDCAVSGGAAMVWLQGKLNQAPTAIVVGFGDVGGQQVDFAYTALVLDGGAATKPYTGTTPIQFDTWRDFAVELTLGEIVDSGKPGARFTVSHDGTTTLEAAGEGALTIDGVQLRYGASATPATAPCTVHYDNVVFDATP